MGKSVKEGIMPKETIHASTPAEHDGFQLSVGWYPDQEVQVGMQVRLIEDTILDRLYSSHAEEIGRVFAWWLTEEYAKWPEPATKGDDDWFAALGNQVLSWVRSNRSFVERDGIWTSMDRRQINEAIKILRKARDSAYGRDE